MIKTTNKINKGGSAMGDGWSNIDDVKLLKFQLAQVSLKKAREVLKKLRKDHEDLQQNHDKLFKQNLNAGQFIKEAIISINLAVPAFEGLWHLVPGNQLSDQQKLAIAAAESLKSLIKNDLQSMNS